jgi:hypothetical protein
MEAARPRGHNRAYKKAAWLKLRVEKLRADPQCEFCHEAAATEVDHINGDAWDKRVQAVSFLADDARAGSRASPLRIRLAGAASPVTRRDDDRGSGAEIRRLRHQTSAAEESSSHGRARMMINDLLDPAFIGTAAGAQAAHPGVALRRSPRDNGSGQQQLSGWSSAARAGLSEGSPTP